jgi:hypothetical protein
MASLIEPGEIRLSTMEQTGDGINQYRKARLIKLTTRLAQRQTPFDPTIACLTRRAMGAFAPHDLRQTTLPAPQYLTQGEPQRFFTVLTSHRNCTPQCGAVFLLDSLL